MPHQCVTRKVGLRHEAQITPAKQPNPTIKVAIAENSGLLIMLAEL